MMLKLLLKKQLLEIFQVYFYDAKKNKARSKTSTVMYFVWFILLVFWTFGWNLYISRSKVMYSTDYSGDGLDVFCSDGIDCCVVRGFW